MKKLETTLQELLASILQHLGMTFRKFKVEKEETIVEGKKYPLFRVDIDTDEASTLIGHHGETIYALQQIVKTIMWQKTGKSIYVIVDVDSYRKRQEESVKKIALRKVELARKTLQDQLLPPMSAYFRRVIHLYLTEPEFSDVTTESVGEGDHRQVVIRLKQPSV